MRLAFVEAAYTTTEPTGTWSNTISTGCTSRARLSEASPRRGRRGNKIFSRANAVGLADEVPTLLTPRKHLSIRIFRLDF